MLVPTKRAKKNWMTQMIYEEKYMKIIFNSDDELPLNEVIEIPSMIMVFTAVFYECYKNGK